MPEQAEIKRALETILGYELPEEALQRIQLLQAVAAYDRTDVPGYFVTRKSLISIFPPKTCEQENFLDVSGWWLTGNDGKTVFRLTDFICEGALPFMQPISLVVTPISSKPCFATVLHSLVKNAADEVIDVEIQVFTWDASGAAAPSISFDWRCRVPVQIVLK